MLRIVHTADCHLDAPCASLDAGVRRAIDLREGDELDADAFKALIREAVRANRS